MYAADVSGQVSAHLLQAFLDRAVLPARRTRDHKRVSFSESRRELFVSINKRDEILAGLHGADKENIVPRKIVGLAHEAY